LRKLGLRKELSGGRYYYLYEEVVFKIDYTANSIGLRIFFLFSYYFSPSGSTGPSIHFHSKAVRTKWSRVASAGFRLPWVPQSFAEWVETAADGLSVEGRAVKWRTNKCNCFVNGPVVKQFPMPLRVCFLSAGWLVGW